MTTLMVASTGGHLTQLRMLWPRLDGLDSNVVWVTPDSPQSRSLLAQDNVYPIRYTHPRDLVSTTWNLGAAMKLLRLYDVSSIVSTGAAVAVSFFPYAASRGVQCHYIESATRVQGPSLTGRIIEKTPGVFLYSQYRSWATGSWQYRGSVFDGYAVQRQTRPQEIKNVVVSLGSIERFGFRRLVERLIVLLADTGANVIWQTGVTDVTGLPIRAHGQLPATELQSLMRAADLVICHAGTGSALSALAAGKTPLLVPRRSDFGEHIDDHQVQIAEELGTRGLAVCRDVSKLQYEDLAAAAASVVVSHEKPPRFRLAHAAMHPSGPRSPARLRTLSSAPSQAG